MSEAQYRMTISIENDSGVVSATYVEVSRQDLLKNANTAHLLRVHDQTFSEEENETKGGAR